LADQRPILGPEAAVRRDQTKGVGIRQITMTPSRRWPQAAYGMPSSTQLLRRRDCESPQSFNPFR